MDFTWTSIASWLIRAGMGGSALILGTLLAMRCVRQPARRQRLGELGMAAALMLAALCWAPAWLPLWHPAASAPAVGSGAIAPQQNLEDLAWIDFEEDSLPPEAAPAPLAVAPASPEPTAFTLGDWLLPAGIVAYGLGASFYLMRWLAGVVVLWRIVRAARPATPDLFSELCARWQGRRPPRLLISDRLPVPASCGVFRPTLILPANLVAPEYAAQREWVFDHEVTHLARRDAWSAVLFAMGQVCYFVLPWFWWLKRIVRLCQEYVADAAACRQRPADEYAEFLLSLTSAPPAPLAATGVTGATSDLYRRVTMLLQNRVHVDERCPRLWTAGVAGVLFGAAVLAAGIGPAQAQQPNQKEVLEQLERIQDMVNKLRTQIAQPPADGTKKAEKSEQGRRTIIIELDKDGKKSDRPAVDRDVIKDRIQVDVKKSIDAAMRDAELALQKALTGDVDRQRAQAELERARADLQARMAQLEKQAADLKAAQAQKPKQELERAAGQHQQAIEHYHRALAIRLPAQAGADKDVKAAIELLQKHLADLKDADSQKRVQDAINRLKDAIKRVEATPRAVVPPIPPIPSKPGLPGAAPAPPAVPATPGAKKSVIVWGDKVAPNVAAGQFLAEIVDGDNLKLWTKQAARGRLGIRVDAPSDLLAEQLNLPKNQGLVIAEVFDKSVAAKAGLKANDILLKINQQPVSSEPEKLIKQIADIKADTPFDIVVLRRGKLETIANVRLPEPEVRARTSALRALGDLAGAQGAQITITVKRSGNELTLHRNEGGVGITVQAQTVDGKTKVASIEVVEKGKSSKYGKVDEVPEPNRAKVQHLIQLLDSTSLDAPARFYRYQRNAPGAEPGKGAELYYRQPQDSNSNTQTYRYRLRADGSLAPLEVLEDGLQFNVDVPLDVFLRKLPEPGNGR